MTSKTVVDGNGQNAQSLSTVVYDYSGSCASFNTAGPDPQLNSSFLHDAANRTDHLANVSQVSTPGNGTTCSLYDILGNVYITEGPGRPQQQVSYASASNYAAPSTIRMNQDQQSLSSFTYTPWLGVSSYSGPNGSTGNFIYDNYAQPTMAILTTGAQVQLQNYPGAAYPQYFPNSSNGYPWAQLSYVDGHYTRKTFDGLGRTVREERGPTGANSVGTPTSVVETQYGSCACSPTGKMIRQSQPYAPGATVYWTTYTYDGMGRTVTVTGPDGSSQTKITYNATFPGAAAPPALGSSVTTVDPKGNWKIVTTDGFGNVSRVTEPDPAGGSPYVTQYLYDRIDHLTNVSMPRSGYTQTRSFVYDRVSFKLMNETHPETGTTKYQYNPGPHGESRLSIKTDAKNQQTKIEDGDYDVYNRPVRMKFLAPVAANAWAEDPCQQVTYTYDNYPATAGTNLNNGFGRVTTTQVGPGDATAACKVNAGPADGSRTNQNFLQAFGYTSAGQIALKRLQFSQIVTPASGTAPPPTVTTWDTKYTYDDEGFQTSVTYPMGQTHQIGLDFLKRPYSLTYQKPGVSVPGPFIQSVGYNAADQMTEMIWADNGGGVRDPDAYSYGVTYERRTYNQTNQLTRIYAFPANQAATVDLNYQYPAGQNNGQISSVTSGTDGTFNATYTYDSLKRLTSLGGAKIQNYSYDGWGNLYSKTGDGSTFTVNIDSGTNRPYGGGICYDANGNLLSTISQCAPEYVYDMKNRLVKVAVSSNGMTDVSGHVDLSAELYFYTADNKRVTTVRPNGNLAQVFYVYGAKSEIAAICTTQFFGQAPVCDPREPRDVKFAGRTILQNYAPVLVDRLGSVIANPAGGTGSTPPKYYLPFGEQYNSTQSPPSVPGNTNFATYLKDQSTGLDYADQRFYNSNHGFSRFITADPYRASAGPEEPGSWNRYSYVAGDPVNHADPSGLCIINGVTYSDGQSPCPNVTGVTVSGEYSTVLFGPNDGNVNKSESSRTGPTKDELLKSGDFKLSSGVETFLTKATNFCSLVPAGRIIGLNGALGVLGGASISAELVLDYRTGQASLAVSGGFGPSGAIAQIGASAGFVYGGVNAIQNYVSGGNTTLSASLPGGLGVSITSSSGGISGDPFAFDPLTATAVQVAFSVGLQRLFFGFSGTTQNTITNVSLGSFVSGLLLTPLDAGLAEL